MPTQHVATEKQFRRSLTTHVALIGCITGAWLLTASTHHYILAPASVLSLVATDLNVPSGLTIWLVSAVHASWAFTNFSAKGLDRPSRRLSDDNHRGRNTHRSRNLEFVGRNQRKLLFLTEIAPDCRGSSWDHLDSLNELDWRDRFGR